MVARNVNWKQGSSHTFLQKKKGKKRKPSCLVEGFKKASFLGKILFAEGGMEILSGTEGLNLLF
ncbi:hypothetical protein DPN68_12005 [Flavobacterium tibetense]|uniref:Uncharacterized protein n=1 Tax=Flavobacterium tibetense TaxID=2233533 RepID=A0A365NYZ6_9FLAO|nr:hypothetical protein DPN68_12005 [Flavobacterium tibetense]